MRKLPKKRFLQAAKFILRNRLAGEAIYPFYCSFKLTRRCNFTCSFCNCWHVKNRWKDMPTEDVKAILDNIAQSSVMVLSFEGGDPLVRDDIGEILRYQADKPWYLLFTTSERDLQNRYPMAEYCKYIDFLHISIDEGHQNLEMFDDLEEFTRFGSIVTVQIVVTKNDIDALEWKIKRCYDAGVKAVVMVAVRLRNTRDHLPDLAMMSRKGLELRRKYPGVIISPKGYFKRILQPHGCDTSSIIVDADGYLYYPCRVLEAKTINLKERSLMEYLESEEAAQRRRHMASCDLRCGWYQYFATQSFVSPREVISAWSPYFRDILNGGRQPVAPVPHMVAGRPDEVFPILSDASVELSDAPEADDSMSSMPIPAEDEG
jgi:MoaA/NifB/PqqE/SkfB family radical SAM enzyme